MPSRRDRRKAHRTLPPNPALALGRHQLEAQGDPRDLSRCLRLAGGAVVHRRNRQRQPLHPARGALRTAVHHAEESATQPLPQGSQRRRFLRLRRRAPGDLQAQPRSEIPRTGHEVRRRTVGAARESAALQAAVRSEKIRRRGLFVANPALGRRHVHDHRPASPGLSGNRRQEVYRPRRP